MIATKPLLESRKETERLLMALREQAGDDLPLGGSLREAVSALFQNGFHRGLEFKECRIEHLGRPVEGSAYSLGTVSRFEPQSHPPEVWTPGSEGRLRHSGGSLRIVVLGTHRGELLFARAPAHKDRRAFRRAAAEGVAILHLHGMDKSADVYDISEGGVGLGAPFAVEIGESMRMLLRIEGRGPISLECAGIVRCCRKISPTECRVGVEFTEVPAAMREAIRDRVTQVGDA